MEGEWSKSERKKKLCKYEIKLLLSSFIMIFLLAPINII